MARKPEDITSSKFKGKEDVFSAYEADVDSFLDQHAASLRMGRTEHFDHPNLTLEDAVLLAEAYGDLGWSTVCRSSQRDGIWIDFSIELRY